MSERFIFYGGTREKNDDGTIRKHGIAHNDAFFHGAVNVRNDYQGFKTNGTMKKITNAAAIVSMLNKQKNNSIKSLDILSHGTQVSLNFSEHDDQNCGFVTSFYVKTVWNLVASRTENTNEFAGNFKYFSDIDFAKFTEDARIQFHGCTTAGLVEINGMVLPVDNIAVHISKLLYEKGKKSAYYIGHTTKIGPSIRGDKTTIKQQDYRHGERIVVHNGKTIITTTKKGYLSHENILKKISGKR